MTMTHTPGPWNWIHTDDRDGNDAWELLGHGSVAIGEYDSVVFHGANWPMTEPDARLIASAPDLLAALKALTSTARTFRNVPKNEQEWTDIDDLAMDQASDAIEKAEGR